MSATGAILGLAGAVSLSIWYGVWALALAQRPVVVSTAGRFTSRVLVVAYMAVNFISLARRDDEALLRDGLSLQNDVQAAVTVVCVSWAGWLLLRRRVALDALLSGPVFWFSLLFASYALSIFWSVWPAYTAYRVVELAAMFVVAAHLFAGHEGLEALTDVLAAATIVFLLAGVCDVVQGYGAPGTDAATILHSNQGSLMAASLIFIGIFRRLFRFAPLPKWQWVLALASLPVFASLATVIALSCALALAALLHPARLRPLGIALAGLAAGIVLAYATQGIDIHNPLIRNLAAAFGKQPENILNFTGRIPLWREIWQLTGDKPFGLGFAAGDRAFVVSAVDRASVGWEAGHAHNGYLSAWLGSGCLGLAFLIVALIAIAWRGWAMQAEARVLVVGLLTLLAINNLTVPAVGGQMNPAWFVGLALCFLNAERNPVSRNEK